MMYGRRQKKVSIYRPNHGSGNTVPFPFRSRLISVRLPFLSIFKSFIFCPKGSSSVLVYIAWTAKLNDLGNNSAGI